MALTRRFSHHHQPAFILGALQQQLVPTEPAVFRVFQRKRPTPPKRQSSNGVSDLKDCCTLAPAACFSPGHTAWRTSTDGSCARDRHQHRRVFRTVQHSLAIRSSSARALSSSSSSNGGGCSQEMSTPLPVDVGVANTESGRRKEAVQGSKCGVDDDHDSSAARVESMLLVDRVASALKQRCSVRGGDLVRTKFVVPIPFGRKEQSLIRPHDGSAVETTQEKNLFVRVRISTSSFTGG